MKFEYADHGGKEYQELRARLRKLKGRLHFLENRTLAVEHGSKPSALRAVVDPNECISCGICCDTCPTGAISLNETARVDSARCMGCGLCVEACPRGAIQLKSIFH
ncbi:MAG: 4Fe-4S binding protein [Thermodesulfobacteriota bacterium]